MALLNKQNAIQHRVREHFSTRKAERDSTNKTLLNKQGKGNSTNKETQLKKQNAIQQTVRTHFSTNNAERDSTNKMRFNKQVKQLYLVRVAPVV